MLTVFPAHPISQFVKIVRLILALSVFSCAGFAQSQPSKNPSGEEGAKQQVGLPIPANNNGRNEQEISIKSPLLVHLQESPKAKEEADQIAADRKEKIAFDRSYLHATWWLVGIGISTIVVYGFQCRLLIRTLNHSRESTERAQRAYVTIVHGRENKDVRWNVFTLIMMNCGQTPAYDVQPIFDWRSFDGADAHWPKNLSIKLGATLEGTYTLGSGIETPVSFDLRAMRDAKDFQIALDRADKREVTLYYFGIVNYRDSFDKKRFTKYLFRHFPGHYPSDAEVCIEGNNSD